MRVFVLKENHPCCGEEFVYVCRTRDEVEKIVTDQINDEYGGERGVKKQLKECLKDIRYNMHGECADVEFDVYETEFELPKEAQG